MSIALLADRRRERVFKAIAESVVADGLAVGLADPTGHPTVLASVRPVRHCGRCGEDRPVGHPHQEEVAPDGVA